MEDDEALRWTMTAGGAACNDARIVTADEGWEVAGDPIEGDLSWR